MGLCSDALRSLLLLDLSNALPRSEFCSLERGDEPPPGISTRSFACFALARSFLKKFEEDESADAREKALSLFLAMNQRCREWVEPVAETEVDALLLGEFRSSFLQCFETPGGGVVDFPELVPMYFRTGPGSSVGVSETNYYTKVCDSLLTTTSKELYWLYYAKVLEFDLEHRVEVKRSELHGCFSTVAGNKLGFAPKSREIQRTICTEPSLNMLFQLGTGAVLEQMIKRSFGIDLSTQPALNSELARRGSLSGRYGTIDLKSASDSVSSGLWNWVMPYPEVRDWFRFLRSPCTTLPSGDVLQLDMLSSMGNGFTFPLQTLLFLCAVRAAYAVHGVEMVYNHLSQDKATLLPGNFGVFGDDIIVVKECYNSTIRLLGLLGFIVNTEKSFNEGAFRESCGTDWLVGSDVRGVYCKKLRRPQDRYSLINRLSAWSSKWEVPLTNLISALVGSVYFVPIPPWENEDAGIIVPEWMVVPKRSKRYHGSYIYARFVPDPASNVFLQVPKPSDGATRVAELSRKIRNPDGILLSAVRGYLRDGLIYTRKGGIRYKKRLSVAPNWEYQRTSQAMFTPEGWRTFQRAYAEILLGRKA